VEPASGPDPGSIGSIVDGAPIIPSVDSDDADIDSDPLSPFSEDSDSSEEDSGWVDFFREDLALRENTDTEDNVDDIALDSSSEFSTFDTDALPVARSFDVSRE